MASIAYGSHQASSPALDGQTIEQARCSYKSAWGIPDAATPNVNGLAVNGSKVLRSTDDLVFIVPTGAKGK